MWVKNRGLVLVCTERKSRLTKLAVLHSHRAKEVAALTEKLLKQAKGPVLTVTNDNGGEFRWKDPLGYKCYYCEPHKPHQRGSVENVIGLLRRYIKRDSDAKELNIKMIEERLNDRPRRCHVPRLNLQPSLRCGQFGACQRRGSIDFVLNRVYRKCHAHRLKTRFQNP